jgi:hypothetical protein
MYQFVIVQDPQGYYTWQLEGPPSRGHSRAVALAPQSWASKDAVLAEVKKMKIHMFTAAIVDNARGK